MYVLIEEVENRVGVTQLPPLPHMLVPGPIGHCRKGQGAQTQRLLLVLVGCPLPSPPFSKIRPTFSSHELLQEAVPGARVRVHLGHAVEVVIGDSHILGIAGDVDYLER